MNKAVTARLGLVSIALFGTLLPASVQANPDAARNNLVANMRRANLDTTQLAGARSVPTPVKHMYILNNPQGKFLGLTNEAGTFIGGDGGYEVIQPAGLPRPMTASETALLRREVMENIDLEKLIKVQYGNGGGRKILLFSAIDCPACHSFETVTANMRNLDTTYYVVPGSLQKIAQGGMPKMATVTRVLCATDSGAAWKDYWAKKNVPPAGKCDIDPQAAENDYEQLRGIMNSIGIRVVGTPTAVREDGTVIIRPKQEGAFRDTFGPAGVSAAPAPQAAMWLADASMANDSPANAAGATPTKGAAPGDKIKASDLLKKLFK